MIFLQVSTVITISKVLLQRLMVLKERKRDVNIIRSPFLIHKGIMIPGTYSDGSTVPCSVTTMGRGCRTFKWDNDLVSRKQKSKVAT